MSKKESRSDERAPQGRFCEWARLNVTRAAEWARLNVTRAAERARLNVTRQPNGRGGMLLLPFIFLVNAQVRSFDRCCKIFSNTRPKQWTGLTL